MPKAYLFIDTNILLDLYDQQHRVRVKALEDAATRLADIIGTGQVRDEFYRNRISSIAKVIQSMKNAGEKPKVPAALHSDAEKLGFNVAHTKYEEITSKLRSKLESFIHEPDKDPTLQLVDAMFQEVQPFLDRGHPNYEEILNRARDRLELGNPPNKQKEPNLGDPLNWEACLHFCKMDARSLIICSNDSDYSTTYGNERFPNHYLVDEFSRVMGGEFVFEVKDDLTKALRRLDELNK